MTSQLKWVKDLNRLFFQKKIFKWPINTEKMPNTISHQEIGNQKLVANHIILSI
jgi:hypothetical protein